MGHASVETTEERNDRGHLGGVVKWYDVRGDKRLRGFNRHLRLGGKAVLVVTCEEVHRTYHEWCWARPAPCALIVLIA